VLPCTQASHSGVHVGLAVGLTVGAVVGLVGDDVGLLVHIDRPTAFP